MEHFGGQAPLSVTSQIPLDVLEVIFKCLNPPDLAVCCRVNKPVSALAHEALYTNLYPNRRNVMHLCLKLCNEPELARRARAFTLCDDGVDMYLGIISDALAKLPRLHTLVLFIGPLSSWILPHASCPPFTLHTFSSAFFLDDYLVSFLQHQKSLTHVGMSIPKQPTNLRFIRPQLFPHLISIFAPMSVVEAIVPGRPVLNVTSYDTSSPKPPSIACLSRSTAPTGVRRLMLNYAYLTNVRCEDLALSAPNLINLTIDADTVKPDDEELLDDFVAWIEEYLSFAKSLECLSIRFHPTLSTIPCQEIDFSYMITSIFASGCLQLRHVVLTFYGYRTKYVCKKLPGNDWYIVNG